MTTNLVRAGNTGETAVFTFIRKVFFWLKMHFNPKFLKRLKRQLFSVDNFFPVVAGTWLGERRVCFFGPEISVYGRKIQFLPHDPNFGQSTVCSPWRDRSFPTSGAIFDFLFSSYSPFCKKKTWLMRQKVFPLPTVRAPSASNSPSALSAQAG